MAEFIPLTLLRRGDVANVSQLVGAPEHVRRLEELGLRAGTRIELIQGGSPCIVRVDGSTLCFRDNEGVRIFVSPRKSA
jgi:Fe2+ transport system protein FeoA